MEEQQEDAVERGPGVGQRVALPALPLGGDEPTAQHGQRQVAVDAFLCAELGIRERREPHDEVAGIPLALCEADRGEVVHPRVVVGEAEPGRRDWRQLELLIEELVHESGQAAFLAGHLGHVLRASGWGSAPSPVRVRGGQDTGNGARSGTSHRAGCAHGTSGDRG